MMIRRRMLAPGWNWRNPFEELEEMRSRMEKLSRLVSGDQAAGRSAGVYPLVNITENTDNYWVRAELPGVRADELGLSITGNSLAITGERKIGTEDDSAKYHRREREAGKFSRMVELPDMVDAEKIEARVADGILTVKLPKSATAKPRQIKVG